ncbi:MAG: DNA repair protein RadC [Burkholderiaceae bacterium]
MPGISDWPATQRPRERLLNEGASALSDAELLAVCLRTGTAGKSALDLAHDLLIRFDGVHGLTRASLQSACSAHGLGPAKWAMLQASTELVRRSLKGEISKGDALSSPRAVRDYLTLWLRDRPSESFVALFLDNQNRLLSAEELFRGTLSQTAVYPREIVRRAIELNAGAVIFAHNHPSGLAEPSHADRLLTDALKTALSHLEIRVLDHLIIAGNKTMSFAEHGLL